MSSKYSRFALLAAAAGGLIATGFAAAEGEETTRDRQATQQTDRDRQDMEQQGDTARTARTESQRDAMDAQEQVNEGVNVVNQMKKDPQLTKLLERAQGVYIVPDFGKAAVGVGGRGGEGVLLVKQNGEWSGPAFFNFGRISAGLQAGAEAGSIAMLLMTQDAVRPFKAQQDNFSLDAAAGLTIIDYSAQGRSAASEPDVITWSDTEGLFAGASIGVSGFTRDEDENRAYYKKSATPQQIFSGTVQNPHADALKDALPTRTASR